MEAEWKCAIMVLTVRSVMRTGLTVMPVLSVRTLVTILIVSIYYEHDPFGHCTIQSSISQQEVKLLEEQCLVYQMKFLYFRT